MALTFDDIAREAKVSRATVSRFFNGNVPLKEKTATRIKRTVERLGYSPPLTRRGPKPRPENRGSHQGVIALVAVGGASVVLAHPTTAAVVECLQSACHQNGFGLMLDQMIEPEQLPFSVSTQQVSGCIIMGAGARFPSKQSTIARACVEQLAAHVPCVLLFSPGHSVPSVDHFTGNDVAIGSYAYRHLCGEDCTAFAVVQGDPFFHEASLVRGRSLADRAALAGAGVTFYCDASAEYQAERHFGNPVVLYKDFSHLQELLGKSSRKQRLGVFVTLDDQIAPIHEQLNRAGLLEDCIRLAVATTTDIHVRHLLPKPIAIDLSMPLIAENIVERLKQRLKSADLRAGTFLAPPRAIKD